MPIDPTPDIVAPVVVRRARTSADRCAPTEGNPTRHILGRQADAATAVLRASAAGSAPLRRALLRRAVALAVACAVFVVGGQRLSAADRDRSVWGETTRVLVLDHDVAAGESVGPDDLVWKRWPTALVPNGAARAAPEEPRRVGTALARGEVMLQNRWADEHRGEWAVELTQEEAAVQVTLQQSLDGIARGDRVDVIASADALTSLDPAGPIVDTADGLSTDFPSSVTGPSVVAVRARVLRVDESSVVLAVGRDAAAATAAAAISGPVTLVVHP